MVNTNTMNKIDVITDKIVKAKEKIKSIVLVLTIYSPF